MKESGLFSAILSITYRLGLTGVLFVPEFPISGFNFNSNSIYTQLSWILNNDQDSGSFSGKLLSRFLVILKVL